MIFGSKPYVVFFIKMEQCRYCIEFLNEWQSIASDSKLNSKISFVKLEISDDIDKHIIEQIPFNVVSFPTILICTKKDNSIEEFKQPRNKLKEYLYTMISK